VAAGSGYAHASFSGWEANQVGFRQSERVWTKRVHLEIVKESGPHEQDEPAHILAVRIDHYRINRIKRRLQRPKAGWSGSDAIEMLETDGAAPALAAWVRPDVECLQPKLLDSWKVMGKKRIKQSTLCGRQRPRLRSVGVGVHTDTLPHGGPVRYPLPALRDRSDTDVRQQVGQAVPMTLTEQAEAVDTPDDLATFALALRQDLLSNPSRWENVTLDGFLEAFAGWCSDMSGYFRNREEGSQRNHIGASSRECCSRPPSTSSHPRASRKC